MSELHLPPQELASTTAFRFKTPPHPHYTRTQKHYPLQRRSSQDLTATIMVGYSRKTKLAVMLKSSLPQCTAPVDALLNVPEPFEEVLAQLPFLDLVIATGVNTTFRLFIFSSPRLKRKLFLLPTKPQGSRKQRKHLDTNGIYGAFMSHNDCLNNLDALNSPSVSLCPSILEPSHHLRSAHLSIRAVEAHLWPYFYLTNPPCVHAHVYFTYGGTNSEGVYVLVEAGRSIYRRDGVTLTAIQEALEQSGSVKVSHGGLVGTQRGRFKVGQKHAHQPVYDTTVKVQVVRCEKRYKCKLSLVLKKTTIKLHGDPVVSEEGTGSMVPVGGIQALYMSARKIRFKD